MAIGVAIIGSGIFAKGEHLPAIQATPTLSLKAVYSRSFKSARALTEDLSDGAIYSDDSPNGKRYEDLLRRDDITGVVIALPILTQPEFIKKALAAGKHVLAEKPIAKDVATAQALLSWTQDASETTAMYAVAENFRYLDSFLYAAREIASLGRVLTFRVRVAAYVEAGGKYFETAWRKVPEYQGGFLLDGGVHFIAAMRVMLQGGGEKIHGVSAFTAQLQKHLPPVDTLNSTLKLGSGASGTLSVSFGTTDKGSEYMVACEKGSVHVSRGKVTVVKEGKEVVKEFGDEGNGVGQEIKAWSESLEKGQRNEAQSPEEALSDLKILEACLRSGEQDGNPMRIDW
ncbi:hypothetical protein IAQ61_005582 [Plenodomus lingam]|uniref:uncharacterized protein n=1 Tax=Leptosphaeria maculans TaxID=5022 RepID=UPI00332128F9|nr:hypothetical protein IAQ61_005582 [Plenodomus lingam]